jgi:hypothetical protein
VDTNTVQAAICDESWDMLTDKVYSSISVVVIPQEVHTLVLDFIKNTATFKFDGNASSLKVVKAEPVDIKVSADWDYIFTIDFQTAHPGHGDRTGQMLAQVVTNHTASILVRDGKVISATAMRPGTSCLIKQ